MATLYAGTSGFAYPAWKPGFYPAKTAGQPVSEALRRTAELRGDQLHVPPPALGLHAGELGGADARRVRLRGEGEHAHHPHPAPEERRRGHRALSENDRPAAQRAPPGTDSVPVAAGDEVRRGAACATTWNCCPPTCATPSSSATRAGWWRRCTTRCGSATCRCAWRNRRGSKCPQVITADFVYYRLRKPEYTAEDVDAHRRALEGAAGDRARSVPDVQARGESRRRAECGDGAAKFTDAARSRRLDTTRRMRKLPPTKTRKRAGRTGLHGACLGRPAGP